MNKNVLIGILVLIIIVLGYVSFKGGDFQQASIIKSQNSERNLPGLSDIKNFIEKDKGTLVASTPEDFDNMINAMREVRSSVAQPAGSTDLPYTCYVQLDGGGVYMYNYNSLYDHGAVWEIQAGTWMCFAD